MKLLLIIIVHFFIVRFSFELSTLIRCSRNDVGTMLRIASCVEKIIRPVGWGKGG